MSNLAVLVRSSKTEEVYECCFCRKRHTHDKTEGVLLRWTCACDVVNVTVHGTR